MKQSELAAHLDITPRALRDFLKSSGLAKGSPDEIRTAYIRHLRETAAGRAGVSTELNLVDERARLAKAQADKVEMQNAVARGELLPAHLLEQVLASTGARIQSILATIKVEMRRRYPELKAARLAPIDTIVEKALSQCAKMSADDVMDDSD